MLALVLAGLVALAAWAWTPDLTRGELEARFLEQPGDLRRIGDTQLHVRDEGPRDAPVVLLLHGFGSSLQTWDDWSAGLRDRWRVVRLDLPGHGLSEPDPADDYTDARSRTRLLQVLDALGIRRVTLVGHSIGGRIAWGFAARHPERVERLVLVAPDGFASPGFEYGRAPEVPATAALMRWSLPRPVLRSALEPAYADPAALTEARLERHHALMRAPGVRAALLARMQQTVLEDPSPSLAAISAPVLLLWGERDAMIPVENARDYLMVLGDARLTALPGIGHLPQEEAPERSLQALRAFIDAASRPPVSPAPR